MIADNRRTRAHTDWPLILLVATAVIICKHWGNYRRILKGEEMGLRGVSKGKYRVN